MQSEDMRMASAISSIDPTDVGRFDKFGSAWWDERGPMGKLHEINPVRLRYLRDLIALHRPFGPAEAPLAGCNILDIGCGGGILAEPLARLGASVTGIDPAPNNIAVARSHSLSGGLTIAYRATTAETLVAEEASFDVVLAMEVVEHVVDRDAFVATVARLVAPGGLLVLSTLNRTAKSYLLAILGAEYVLRWLPRGTHRWMQFVTPNELATSVRAAGLRSLGTKGMVYDLLSRDWRLAGDTDVNYFLAAIKLAT